MEVSINNIRKEFDRFAALNDVSLKIASGELIALLVIGLLVLGPERLPRYAAEAGRFLHTVRTMAARAREDVRSSLEPELRDLGVDRRDLATWFGDEDEVPRPRRSAPTGGTTPPNYPDAT